MNNHSFVGAPMTATNQKHAEKFRMTKLEQFIDPNSKLNNSNIMNIVSPCKEKMGFHITDLLSSKNRSVKSQRRHISEEEKMKNSTMFEKWSSQGSQVHQHTAPMNKTLRDNRFMIKNFKIVNKSENDMNSTHKFRKPITAAPMALDK